MVEWMPLLVGVSGALVAGLLAYLNALRVNARMARLARVNEQLEELYGPLLALTEYSRGSWASFRARYRPDALKFVDADEPLSDEERRAWVAWISTVLQPANRRISELLVTKSHLLDDDHLPAPLVAFLAHVAGYDVTLAAWHLGNYEELTSVANHPGEVLTEYARTKFSELKARQKKLLGQRG